VDILNLDALSLNEEIVNIRRGGTQKQAGFTNGDKILIHMRYLLSTRFEDSLDLVFKILQTFVEQVGGVVSECSELLVVIANMRM